MRVYLVGSGGTRDSFEKIQLHLNPRRLFSYFAIIDEASAYGEEELFMWMAHLKGNKKGSKKKLSLFLDSGAFSAFTKGVHIPIDQYIQFIKDNKPYLEYYSVLDEIGNAEKTLQNQLIMEKAGLKPVPCYHYNEPFKYLQYYMERNDFVALGGMVPIPTPSLRIWLDHVFSNYICDKDGMPKCKVHGFGMTSHELMIRYPWYSVDSTSWVLMGRFGAIAVPKMKSNSYDYTHRPHIVDVSNKSSAKQKIGEHLENFSPNIQKQILHYLEAKGYKVGKSQIKLTGKGYKLEQGERWFDRKTGKVEVIVEEGVSNNYRLRDEVNVLYYLDLEDSLQSWPWPFKLKSPRRFGR